MKQIKPIRCFNNKIGIQFCMEPLKLYDLSYKASNVSFLKRVLLWIPNYYAVSKSKLLTIPSHFYLNFCLFERESANTKIEISNSDKHFKIFNSVLIWISIECSWMHNHWSLFKNYFTIQKTNLTDKVSNQINQIESWRKHWCCAWVQKEFVVTEAWTHSPGHGTLYQYSEPSVIPLSYPSTPRSSL